MRPLNAKLDLNSDKIGWEQLGISNRVFADLAQYCTVNPEMSDPQKICNDATEVFWQES